LIPRGDTESVIDAFQQSFPDKKAAINILEVGVGSGCILLTLLKLYKSAFGLGLEIMPETLEMTIKNQQKLRVKNGKMILFDVMERNIADLSLFQYDVIVSNPPYIPKDEIWKLQPEVRDFEPYCALNGGKDGLIFYHKLKEMKEILKVKTLIVEIGFAQRQEIEKIFEGYTIVAHQDLNGIDRALIITKDI
jgi:release factor glutamine methyltransferase